MLRAVNLLATTGATGKPDSNPLQELELRRHRDQWRGPHVALDNLPRLLVGEALCDAATPRYRCVSLRLHHQPDKMYGTM